ncbi:MAG: hypothetical protein Q6366_006855 [Candidatus Freyarchaeota archaeon]
MIAFLPVESVMTGLFFSLITSWHKKGLNMISKGLCSATLKDV